MTSLSNTSDKSSLPAALAPLMTALHDAGRGFVAVTRNSMVLLGAGLAALVITLSMRPDVRADLEQDLLGWLMQRQDVVIASPAQEPSDTPQDKTAANTPPLLPKQQAAVTQWLSRKYRVAPEPLSALVAEAFSIGAKVKLDPTLILAVMAIESRFNPYAQSPVGAQGLMQVLTRVHTDKYDNYGGHMAAFDPLINLRVGVKVLQDCIRQAGSVEGGLRLYVGAVTTDGSGYINKVMSEHLRIRSVALGQPMPTTFPVFAAARVPEAIDPAPAEPTQSELLQLGTEPTSAVVPTVAPAFDTPDAAAAPLSNS
jgi:hypothetical protein